METIKTRVADYSVICERYSDIYEFRDTLLSRKLNHYFANRYGELKWAASMGSTLSRESDTYVKFGTFNFEEADTYLTDGYEEGITQLAAAKLRPTTGQRIEYKTDFVGHRPSIGNVVRNMPKQMIRTIRKPAPINEVELVYYNGCGFEQTEAEIAETARKFLNAAYAIEQQGTRVGITILNGPSHNDVDYLTSIRVKRPGQPFNLRKLSYPLVHPSFFRRHIFRWIETAPIFPARYVHNYGGVVEYAHGSMRDCREFLIKAGILKDTDIFVSYYWLKNQIDGDEVVKEMARQNEAILTKK